MCTASVRYRFWWPIPLKLHKSNACINDDFNEDTFFPYFVQNAINHAQLIKDSTLQLKMNTVWKFRKEIPSFPLSMILICFTDFCFGLFKRIFNQLPRRNLPCFSPEKNVNALRYSVLISVFYSIDVFGEWTMGTLITYHCLPYLRIDASVQISCMNTLHHRTCKWKIISICSVYQKICVWMLCCAYFSRASSKTTKNDLLEVQIYSEGVKRVDPQNREEKKCWL